mgnify:FL=1
MLWEYNQIKDKFGTEIAGFVRAFDARLGVGLGSEIDDGTTRYYFYHVHVNLGKHLVTRDSLVVMLPQHFSSTDFCQHTHDCCGCWYRTNVSVANPHGKEGISYWIIDQWNQKV